MRTINKYPISLGLTKFPTPKNRRVLSVGYDENQNILYVCALVDTNSAEMETEVFAVATGGVVPGPDWSFVGTVIDLPLEWHVFVRDNEVF